MTFAGLAIFLAFLIEDPITPFIHLGVYMAAVLACLGLSVYTVISLNRNSKSNEAVAQISGSINNLAAAITTNHTNELSQLTQMAGSMKELAESNQAFIQNFGEKLAVLAVNQDNLSGSVNDLLRDMISAFRSAKEK